MPMKPLKVATLSYHTCPLASFEGKETGGMNVYVYELCRALGKLGVTVDIFTRSQDKKQPHVVNIDRGVRLFHIPAGPEKPFPKEKLRLHLPEFTKNISRIITEQKLDYDLYDAHYYLSGLAALQLNKLRLANKPIITTFHTLALMKNMVARSKSEKDSSYRINAEKLLVKKANKIIEPSQNEKQYLEYLYDCPAEKIEVVIPGINTQLFKPMSALEAKKVTAIPAQKKVILFVGRIEPLKGIDVLLYAVKILLKRNPNFKICLAIVGGDISQKSNKWSGELRKLEGLRRLLHMESIVKFLGQQPQEKLPFFYNSADVLVMPSHYESFGMTALEAMACGIPVIANNVSGVSGLIDRKEELLVSSANNPLLLAKQIEGLITNKTKHEYLGRSLSTKVHEFTWKKSAEHIKEIYKEVLTN